MVTLFFLARERGLLLAVAECGRAPFRVIPVGLDCVVAFFAPLLMPLGMIGRRTPLTLRSLMSLVLQNLSEVA